MGDYISCRVTFSILFSTKDVSFWHIYVFADQKTKSSTLKKAFQDVTCQYYFTVHLVLTVISLVPFSQQWFLACLSLCSPGLWLIYLMKPSTASIHPGAQLGNFERGRRYICRELVFSLSLNYRRRRAPPALPPVAPMHFTTLKCKSIVLGPKTMVVSILSYCLGM